MAKKKTKPRSNYMVRLPDAYRAPLAALKAKTRRPLAAELQMALDAHLKANGVAPPGTST